MVGRRAGTGPRWWLGWQRASPETCRRLVVLGRRFERERWLRFLGTRAETRRGKFAIEWWLDRAGVRTGKARRGRELAVLGQHPAGNRAQTAGTRPHRTTGHEQHHPASGTRPTAHADRRAGSGNTPGRASGQWRSEATG